MGMLRQASSKVLGEGVVNAAIDTAADPLSLPRGLLRGASSALLAVKDAVRPDVEVGVDVLGLKTNARRTTAFHMPPAAPSGPPPPPPKLEKLESAFEEEDLFTVEGVIDANGDLTEMISGVDLTSPVLSEADGLDWPAEMLLLTHEPMRRDMLEMQRALQPHIFGELPDGWRVRAFFRFFTPWCSLVTQLHAIEVQVHYDWLIKPTKKMSSDHRTELLSYHRTIGGSRRAARARIPSRQPPSSLVRRPASTLSPASSIRARA
jgi:hypothetical protein